VRFLLLVGVSCSLVGGSAMAAVVRLRPSAEVAGSVIRLGDIADVSDPDPAVARRLAEVAVAPAPAAGAEGSVSFADIRSRLLAVGEAVGAIEFTGHSLVRVRGAGGGVVQAAGATEPAASQWSVRRGEDVLREAMAEFVTRQWPELGNMHIDVSLTDADAARVAAIGTIPPDALRLDGWKAPIDGPQTLTAQYPGRDGRTERVTVQCRLCPLPFVLTVRAAVQRGRIVQADDLEWMQTASVGDGFTRPADLIGKQAGRTLRAGEPVRAADVESVPLVRPREVVTVTARSAGVSVRREMQAAQAGGLGETIAVTDLDGRERLFVRVTGYHTAEVVGSDDATSARVTSPIRLVNADLQTAPLDGGGARPAVWLQEPGQ
jgi:flagella basal body P-ring formation protein FlgA